MLTRCRQMQTHCGHNADSPHFADLCGQVAEKCRQRRLGKWASKTISCLFNDISSIFHNLIHMAGILRTAVFLKSRPFSKFHPHHVGISIVSTRNAKKQPFGNIPAKWLEFCKKTRLQKSSHLQNPSLFAKKCLPSTISLTFNQSASSR